MTAVARDHPQGRPGRRDLRPQLKEGTGVLILLAAANRDPRAFPNPNKLDLTRYAQSTAVPRHLGFGVGHHYCIGAPLVRLEMECMLRELARAPRS